MYSTHSHSAKAPRLRIVVSLKRPVSADEYQAVSKRIAEDLENDFFEGDVVAGSAAVLTNKLLQLTGGAVHDEHDGMQV